MSRYRALILLVLGAVLLAGSLSPHKPARAADGMQLAGADNGFSFRLFSTLANSSGTGNLFLSPMSVATALQMVYDGAEGETAQAMARTLGLGAMSQTRVRQQASALLSALHSADSKAQLSIANSVWTRKGVPFKQRFLQDAHSAYNAEAQSLDFSNPSALAAINAWVKKSTGGKIPSILTSIPPNVIMYLLNAVYFKGKWSTPFNAGLTRKAPFTTATGSQVQVPLMNGEGRFHYLATSAFQLVSLPYGQGRFSMVVLVPKAGQSLRSIERSLTAPRWHSWMTRLKDGYGSISIPRFSLQATYGLNAPLEALGMGPAFSDGADFSGMCVHPCKISQVKHKTFLKVNEAGTTAAGLTSVAVVPTAVQVRDFTLVANHPFLLAIRDGTTDSILFLGAITNPRAS